jgi:hypothetical protein
MAVAILPWFAVIKARRTPTSVHIAEREELSWRSLDWSTGH